MNEHKINILVVDDNHENLEVIKAVFKNSGYRLKTATSGQEALMHVLKKDFAVILLDVQMPEMDGFETARLIKSREKSNHIPIVFITALSQAMENMLQGYKIGAIDYIIKPFHPKILQLKIAALVDMYLNNKKLKLQSELLQNQTKYMEKLVEERTRALLEINEQLREEIEVRKAITEQLAFSQELFQKIFQSSPGLLAIRSQPDGQFIEVNESWIRHTGYNSDDINKQCSNLLKIQCTHPSCKVHMSPDLQESVHNMHVRYHTKSGQLREGLLSTEKISIYNKNCIISMITDITEKVMFEKEMTRLDRLNLVGKMAAGIAHEIRNPMTTVKGFLQMAENRQLTKDDIELMIYELDRANSIISEYLSLAKGKFTQKISHNLNSILDSVFPLLLVDALEHDVFVSLEKKDIPDISLNEGEIRQLILNLVRNGLEAMPEGGNLLLKTYVDNNDIVLLVQDDGIGICSSMLDKLGTPFFTTKDKGTGLGLSICYSIAERHNAKIIVKTGPLGTSFFVRFGMIQSNNAQVS